MRAFEDGQVRAAKGGAETPLEAGRGAGREGTPLGGGVKARPGAGRGGQAAPQTTSTATADVAQPFRTGSHFGGNLLTGIELRIRGRIGSAKGYDGIAGASALGGRD